MANSSKKKMKTAREVVHRILWDNAIPKESITIGYLDRFLGVIEKPFEEFSWEPLDSIDNYTFGVPEHRIQYFKYKKVIVWDKKHRLDKIFGSSGTNKNIYDVMEHYSDEERNIDYSPRTFNVSDSEDDTVSPEVRDSVIYDTKSQTGKSSKSASKVRETPNYFICQRILTEEFIDRALTVQSHLCKENPAIESLCYNPVLFHLTLCVLKLKDEEEEQRCIQVLEDVKETLISLKPKSIKMKGVKNFDNRVVYVAVELTEQLQNLVTYLISHLTAHNFQLFDIDRFVPHITLVKLNSKTKRQLGIRKIKSSVCEEFANVDFGTQNLDTLHFCSMLKPKDSSGFYHSPGHICLDKSSE